MTMHTLLPYAVLMALLGNSDAADVSFADVTWGFTGSILPRHFNLLTVVATNASSSALTGVITLQENAAWIEVATTVPMRIACTLGPRASCRLHFYVWIEAERMRSYAMRWREDPPVVVPSGIETSPTIVRFTAAASPSPSSDSIPTCGDDRFPTLVDATGALAVAVLDHMPPWQPLQRATFIHWLENGGVAIIRSGADGHAVVFTDELSVLNKYQSGPAIGRGIVLHPAVDTIAIPDLLHAAGIGLPDLAFDKTSPYFDFSEQIQQQLKRIEVPQRQWMGVYVVLACFLLLTGPGAIVAARRRVDYRLMSVAYLAILAGCSAAVWHLGRRGDDEQSQLLSLAYATDLGNGAFTSVQWCSLFSTRRDVYHIARDGMNAFSSRSRLHLLESAISDDAGGRLTIELPMFSSQAFVHSGLMQSHHPTPHIVSGRKDHDGLFADLAIAVADGASAEPDQSEPVLAVAAFYADHLYQFTRGNDTLWHSDRSQCYGADVFRTRIGDSIYAGVNWDWKVDLSVQTRLRTCVAKSFLSLIGYGLGGTYFPGNLGLHVRSDTDPTRINVFLLRLGAIPFVCSPPITQHGGVVYHFDLACPVRSDP